jgi:hypothetical protein
MKRQTEQPEREEKILIYLSKILGFIIGVLDVLLVINSHNTLNLLVVIFLLYLFLYPYWARMCFGFAIATTFVRTISVNKTA